MLCLKEQKHIQAHFVCSSQVELSCQDLKPFPPAPAWKPPDALLALVTINPSHLVFGQLIEELLRVEEWIGDQWNMGNEWKTKNTKPGNGLKTAPVHLHNSYQQWEGQLPLCAEELKFTVLPASHNSFSKKEADCYGGRVCAQVRNQKGGQGDTAPRPQPQQERVKRLKAQTAARSPRPACPAEPVRSIVSIGEKQLQQNPFKNLSTT